MHSSAVVRIRDIQSGVLLTRFSTSRVYHVPAGVGIREVFSSTYLLTDVTFWRLTVRLLRQSQPLGWDDFKPHDLEVGYVSRIYPLDLRFGTRVAASSFWSRKRVGVLVGISTPIGSLFALFYTHLIFYHSLLSTTLSLAVCSVFLALDLTG